MLIPLVGAGLVILTMLVMVALVARNIVRVPPDSVLVVTGRRRLVIDPVTGEQRTSGFRVVRGGSAFVIPMLERVDRLSLNEMAIQIDADDLRDVEGRLRRVSVLVNCHIASDPEHMERAIQRFLSMALPDIEKIIRTTIESRIINTMLSADISAVGSWPPIEAELIAAIRADLAALGIAADTIIFRSNPTETTVTNPANGRA